MDLAPLTASDEALVEAATRTIDAVGDGWVHTVGAAVRAVDGSVYVGVNLYHFTGGPCAELTALATARTQGARELTTIVAVGDRGRGVLSPCGRDRQVLADLFPGIRVILPTPSGPRTVPVAGLLPFAYVAATASRQRVGFAAEYLDAVRAGRKVATIRLRDTVRLGEADLVFESSPEVVLPGEVTSLVRKRLGDVTPEEAAAAGNADLADLAERMPRHYPGITPDDVITIVGFRLTER